MVPKNAPADPSDSERAAYLFIAREGASRTAEIAAGIGLSPRGTLKVLGRLADRGLIEASGATRGRTYRLV